MANIYQTTEKYAKKDLTGTENNLIGEDKAMAEALENYLETEGYLGDEDEAQKGRFLYVNDKNELVFNYSLNGNLVYGVNSEGDEEGEEIELDMTRLSSDIVKKIVQNWLDKTKNELKTALNKFSSLEYSYDLKIDIWREIVSCPGQNFKEQIENWKNTSINNMPLVQDGLEPTEQEKEGLLNNLVIEEEYNKRVDEQKSGILSLVEENKENRDFFNSLISKLQNKKQTFKK